MPRRDEVERWLERYDNPMKDVVLAVRDVVLDTDARVDECVKWQAPTFTYRGNIASFFPKSKSHASLMFHQGALIPGRHAILQGDGATARMVKLSSVAEVDRARAALQAVVRAWIGWKDGAPAKKKVAKKKVSKKKVSKKIP